MLKPFGHVISTRILRDANGLSRGVGFARYAWRGDLQTVTDTYMSKFNTFFFCENCNDLSYLLVMIILIHTAIITLLIWINIDVRVDPSMFSQRIFSPNDSTSHSRTHLLCVCVCGLLSYTMECAHYQNAVRTTCRVTGCAKRTQGAYTHTHTQATFTVSPLSGQYFFLLHTHVNTLAFACQAGNQSLSCDWVSRAEQGQTKKTWHTTAQTEWSF